MSWYWWLVVIAVVIAVVVGVFLAIQARRRRGRVIVGSTPRHSRGKGKPQ
ncbi:MAG: hypothetical protein ABIQ13_13625 [Pedococcus sp.]